MIWEDTKTRGRWQTRNAQPMAMNDMRAGSFLLSSNSLTSRESAACSQAGEPITTRSMLAPAIYYVHSVQRIKIAYL